jgi:gamma-glutamyl:cysteine ligase YbdK (ATP-grasp superfamily)
MSAAPIHAFAGYGIELEYMIVDRQTLAVMPIADTLLQAASGGTSPEVDRGRFGWSNEIVLHLVEVKNTHPDPALEPLASGFQAEIQAINRLLQPMGACLMPTAMHPWMNPAAEARLWPHENASIYQAYDRIFDCRKHGQANLQSMHLNLPFANDNEFARLHAAVRVLLPILPALAASSPVADGTPSGFLDTRMAAYCTAVQCVPSVIGQVIPDTSNSRAEYASQVLAPMYRDLAPLDSQGVLQHEWLNARGAIPRFDRNAIEIRVIDAQECPQADLAIAAAATAVIRALYDDRWSSLAMQQAIGTDSLAKILHACIRDADQAVIDDAGYLRLLGLSDRQYRGGELWRHLVNRTGLDRSTFWIGTLRVMLEQGPLARRILQALGKDRSSARLQHVYRELCDCLETGRMFAEGHAWPGALTI